MSEQQPAISKHAQDLKALVKKSAAAGCTAEEFRQILDLLEHVFIRDRVYYPNMSEAVNAFVGGQAETVRFLRNNCAEINL